MIGIDLLLDSLAAGASDEGVPFFRRESPVTTLRFDFEAGSGDVIFLGEVGEVGIEVERAFALFAKLDGVFARGEFGGSDVELVVETAPAPAETDEAACELFATASNVRPTSVDSPSTPR